VQTWRHRLLLWDAPARPSTSTPFARSTPLWHTHLRGDGGGRGVHLRAQRRRHGVQLARETRRRRRPRTLQPAPHRLLHIGGQGLLEHGAVLQARRLQRVRRGAQRCCGCVYLPRPKPPISNGCQQRRWRAAERRQPHRPREEELCYFRGGGFPNTRRRSHLALQLILDARQSLT
jgi:hypothetical protein